MTAWQIIVGIVVMGGVIVGAYYSFKYKADPIEFIHSHSILLFSVFQLVQIISENYTIAVSIGGDTLGNMMRILPFSSFEMLFSSFFIMAFVGVLSANNYKLVTAGIIVTFFMFIGILAICAVIFAIWMDSKGYTTISREAVDFKIYSPLSWFGLKVTHSNIKYAAGDMLAICNIWSTPIISIMAIGMEIYKKVKGVAKVIPLAVAGSTAGTRPRRGTTAPPGSATTQTIEDVKGVIIAGEHVQVLDAAFYKDKGILAEVADANRLVDLGPTRAASTRYKLPNNRFIPWNNSLNWRDFSKQEIEELLDIITSAGSSGVIPYKALQDKMKASVQNSYPF